MAGKSSGYRVDRDVLVEIFTGAVDYQVVARLDGINDWGGVLNGAEPGGEAVFYPWRLVVAMQLAREEDLGAPPGYPSPSDPAG